MQPVKREKGHQGIRIYRLQLELTVRQRQLKIHVWRFQHFDISWKKFGVKYNLGYD
jgi:hypothetical protein